MEDVWAVKLWSSRASHWLLKIESTKQRIFFIFTSILLLRNPFNYPLLSFPEVRRERWPKPACVYAGCRPCINKTQPCPCDVTLRELQLFWRMGTLWLKLWCSLWPRCILLLQFKLQIHLKYISQKCFLLKCKLCWVWKIFKKSWTLHLGGLHFHVLKKRKEEWVPTHHRHLKKGKPVWQIMFMLQHYHTLLLMSYNKFCNWSYVFSAVRNEWVHGDCRALGDVKLIHTGDFSRPRGININHLWGHLHSGAISCTKAKPPNTDRLHPMILSTLHMRQITYHRITSINKGCRISGCVSSHQWGHPLRSNHKTLGCVERCSPAQSLPHAHLSVGKTCTEGKLNVICWLSAAFSIECFYLDLDYSRTAVITEANIPVTASHPS